MKRLILLLPAAASLLLAALASADVVVPVAGDERARLFARDRDLIEGLVQQGLVLAGEDDPLKRADCCNGVARLLAEQMHEAAANHEGERVDELGQHLSAVLKRGVAVNLSTAVSTPVPSASTFERELQAVHQRTVSLLDPLEERLRKFPDGEGRENARRALHAVSQGRAEVEKALRGRGKTANRWTFERRE